MAYSMWGVSEEGLPPVEFWMEPKYPGRRVCSRRTIAEIVFCGESIFDMSEHAEMTRKHVMAVRYLSSNQPNPFCSDHGPFLCAGLFMSGWDCWLFANGVDPEKGCADDPQ